MARENIEDIIKKVILGEGFLNEETTEEETSDEDTLSEDTDELDEATSDKEDEEEDEDEDEDEDEEEDEDKDEEEDKPKAKKKMPAFLKGKFGKKEKVEEAASDYSSDKMYKTANGKTAKIAEPTGDSSGKNKSTIKPNASNANAKIEKPSMKSEDFSAMFDGQDLSEEFKTSASTLFEAHLNERVRQLEEEMKSQYEDLLEEHTVAVTEELVERIDDYLNYVVEEWMQENRLAVQGGLRTEITEGFISNLRGLFAESYIEVPNEKLDLFESAVDHVETLDDELQDQVEKNMELSEEIQQLQCELVFREVAEGLTDTDIEKLRRLSEDLEFETVAQFSEKINVLRENIESIGNTSEESADAEGLEESYEEADSSEVSPLVEAYVRSISKSRE